MRFLLALSALIVLSCSGANGAEPRPSQPRVEEPARQAPTPQVAEPAVVREEPPADSACGRALTCCRAYVSTVPDVVEESACAGVYDAAERGAEADCVRMHKGWQQVLVHLPEGDAACQ